MTPTSVELFTGAGGLALGLARAGIAAKALVERDRWACETLIANRDRGHPLATDWRVHRADVRDFDFAALEDRIDLVAGGPPCQPFSLGGKHRGRADERDMFPVSAAAVRALRPKAFLFENVRGLARPSFAPYFTYIKLRLTHPEITVRDGEAWEVHKARLERHDKTGNRSGLTYRVRAAVLDAADHGVPQRRHRVFIVGFRSDMDARWDFPASSHSKAALLRDQGAGGGYWDRHRILEAARPPYPNTPVGASHRDLALKPWRTVRDALADLPEPGNPENLAELAGAGLSHHVFQPGARAYPGHTGSPLDKPSKALKAGAHGVPGGENMLIRADGSVRYYTVREAARIQTFPDDYIFHGAWSETMRQLGNAVPVRLAETLARSIASALARR